MEQIKPVNDKPLSVQVKTLNESKEKEKSIATSPGCHIKWNIKALPRKSINIILSEQNYLCATCGIQLKSNFLSKSNYYFCEYTGSMHCRKCHKKDQAIIPYQVLSNLNCKKFMVCIAAKKFLNKMYHVPCINIDMFAKTNKQIIQLKQILFELKHIKQYLDNCNKCQIYNEYKNDWIFYDGSLTLSDCVSMLSSNALDAFQILSQKLQRHIIKECDICKSKGSLCKICKNQNEPLYSFQYNKTIQCKKCQTCFHRNCFHKYCMICMGR